jgi:hypothetical protein
MNLITDPKYVPLLRKLTFIAFGILVLYLLSIIVFQPFGSEMYEDAKPIWAILAGIGSGICLWKINKNNKYRFAMVCLTAYIYLSFIGYFILGIIFKLGRSKAASLSDIDRLGFLDMLGTLQRFFDGVGSILGFIGLLILVGDFALRKWQRKSVN